MGLFGVDSLADTGKRRAGVSFCFEGKSDSNYFKGVGEEDRCYSG